MRYRMTSWERIMAAFLLEEPDAVPISPALWMEFSVPKDYWNTLVKVSDSIYWVQGDVSYGLFLSASDKVRTHTNKVVYCDHEIHESIIETPKGNLVSRSKVSKIPVGPGSFATSFSSHERGYIENEGDVDKFLSIPYEPCRPDPKPFFDLVKGFGDNGLVMFCFPDPICIVAGLFKLDRFYVWIYRKPHLVKALFDAVHPRIMDYVEFLINKGVGPVFNINGPEYACTTFVAPHFFDRFVAAYDRELIKLVHDYGHLVMIHCHGRVNDLLERFVNIGTDALNPLEERSETWDSGDVNLADAKKRVGHKMCLVGSVQTGDLEIGNRELIERRTREAIEKAAEGGGFILMYSGGPKPATIQKTRFCQNLLYMVEAGRKYGRYWQNSRDIQCARGLHTSNMYSMAISSIL